MKPVKANVENLLTKNKYMRIVLLSICIALGATIKAQTNDTTTLAPIAFHIGDVKFYKLYIRDSTVTVSVDDMGNIEILGDSTQALRVILNQLQKQWYNYDSMANKYYTLLESSVAVINNVPDYWKEQKNNCAWKAFYAILKQEGYQTVKRKSDYKTGCK